MTYRIPRSDLVMSDAMPFNQHWEARIPVPISHIEDDAGLAFHAAFSSLRAGDKIEVCAFEKHGGEWKHLLEVATFRVVEISPTKITATKVGETFEVPKPNPAVVMDGVVALDIVPVGGGFEVRDRKGNVIEQFVDEKQAIEFRDREQGRGVKGVVGLTIKRGFGKYSVCDSGGAIIAEFTTKTEAEAFLQSGGQKAA